MISVEDCVVAYPGASKTDRPAIDGLSVGLERGSFVSIVGSNGAGKSTLLKVVSGVAPVTRGRVRLDGEDITGVPPHLRSDRVAQVFQDPLAGTCAELSIEENFAIAARRGQRRGLTRAVDRALRERIRAVLQPTGLGLEARLHVPAGELSGGQRQVLALAMASVAGATVLLLDEHTAALDPATAALVMTMTERIASERALTVLMVTHSLEQALRFGDRTVMLHEGRISLDLTGPERATMTVSALLARFGRQVGRSIDSDRMLLDVKH